MQKDFLVKQKYKFISLKKSDILGHGHDLGKNRNRTLGLLMSGNNKEDS